MSLAKQSITKLVLRNFKNYTQADFQFVYGFNLITGKNGMGKTNLLDAIYYISILKSNFGIRDLDLIKHDQDFFRIEAIWNDGINDKLIELGRNRQNERINKIEGDDIKKKKDWFANFPIFLLTPEDQLLVRDGSAERRKLFDHLLSLNDKKYLEELGLYNRLLKQRNAYLKTTYPGQIDKDILLTYSRQMESPTKYIIEQRALLQKQLSVPFTKTYNEIANADEICEIEYKMDCTDSDYLKIQSNNLEKDKLLKRTTSGIHRDDWLFRMNGKAIKLLGSQGQQKTYILSLKLSLALHYSEIQGRIPVVLIDDIYDKLDKLRIKALFIWLENSIFHQIFISDTDGQRSAKVLREIGAEIKTFDIFKGQLSYEKK